MEDAQELLDGIKESMEPNAGDAQSRRGKSCARLARQLLWILSGYKMLPVSWEGGSVIRSFAAFPEDPGLVHSTHT